MGRHTTYNETQAAEICERIANGEPLRAICRDLHMPHWTTVYAWKDAHEDFAIRIARARELGFDAIAEEALLIADTPEIGVVETDKVGKFGPYTEVRRGDMTEHRKLQIETRLKLLAKWSPKYADKQQIEHSGSLDVAQTIIAARRRAGSS